MEALKKFIVDMRDHPHYRDFEEMIGNKRPTVPLYDPVRDNVDDIKFKSGQQKGYDLFASIMNITFK